MKQFETQTYKNFNMYSASKTPTESQITRREKEIRFQVAKATNKNLIRKMYLQEKEIKRKKFNSWTRNRADKPFP